MYIPTLNPLKNMPMPIPKDARIAKIISIESDRFCDLNAPW